tara:strand:+ start:78 stop:2096 length:2019 start_codon:yes stop_codon:yes gene_type:complete
MKLLFTLTKYLILFTILLLLIIIYDLTSVDFKYVNRNAITIDVNNVRNPQIKKVVRKIDLYLGELYFNLSKKKQDEFYFQDIEKYNSLPDEIIVPPSLENLTISNGKNINNSTNWARSHGNHLSNKFSNLKKINIENVNNLKVAWTHTFEKKSDVPGNPIFFDGVVYVGTPNRSLVALNAVNGKKIWEHKTEGMPARRGLILHKEKKSKIYFCDQVNLIAIYASNGKYVSEFGNKGKIKLKKYCQITPVVLKDKIIIATFEPSIEVYDRTKGKLLWRFYLKEKNTKYFRYGGKRFDYSGGNPWGGISADLDREIVYVSTGNAGFFTDGTTRPGKNKYSNSVVAIDIKNKKLLWEFQEIEHDIWDYDIAAPPILTSIEVNKKKIDVVVAVTKTGDTLVLDRLTGKNIYGYVNKKVPLSTIPGEKVSFYQKKFILPQPFAKQTFNLKDITNIADENHDYVYNKVKDTNFGFFVPTSTDKKNVVYGLGGGAQWMGASLDNSKGILYVPSNNMARIIWSEKQIKKYEYYVYPFFQEILKDQDGYPGSKPPWGNITAIDLNNGKKIWQIPFGEYEELSKKGIPITGQTNMGGVTGTAGNLLFATGTLDRKIRAFDSNNGKELWNYQLPFSGSSPPTIYEYNNEQYILVTSTGSSSMYNWYGKQAPLGNKIFAFKLKK